MQDGSGKFSVPSRNVGGLSVDRVEENVRQGSSSSGDELQTSDSTSEGTLYIYNY